MRTKEKEKKKKGSIKEEILFSSKTPEERKL